MNHYAAAVMATYTDEQKRAIARAIARAYPCPDLSYEFTNDMKQDADGRVVARFGDKHTRELKKFSVTRHPQGTIEYVPAFTPDGEAIEQVIEGVAGMLYLQRRNEAAWMTVYLDDAKLKQD